MSEVTIYNYQNQEIEAILTSNDVALSDEQIGIALGYAEPTKAIAKIVERNTAELDGLSTYVKLTKVEGGREVTRDVRVWGEHGALAISFLAKTKDAIAFRKWARETIYAVRRQNLVSAETLNTALDEIRFLRSQLDQAKQSIALLPLTEETEQLKKSNAKLERVTADLERSNANLEFRLNRIELEQQQQADAKRQANRATELIHTAMDYMDRASVKQASSEKEQRSSYASLKSCIQQMVGVGDFTRADVQARLTEQQAAAILIQARHACNSL